MFKRYWFEFDIDTVFNCPPGISWGCGITAYDLNDAIRILDDKIFSKITRPPFKKVVENVNIQTLDAGHVIPNMKPPINRGVWFPIGYDY
jgi:hypothetical protein